jgi:hypothetical protein
MHFFLKEQKYLKDHAAKIHLIFKSPNENKQNQAFPNQKFHFIDAFPNQKLSFSLHFQTKNYHFHCISKPKRTLLRCISKPELKTYNTTKKVALRWLTAIFRSHHFGK